jgi:nucleoside-triphosphatase
VAKNDPHALLLTGPPGVGKTTAMRRAVEELSELRIRGFTTEEIREAGQRVGFRISTFDGDEAVLAHVKIRSPNKVGKYAVDLSALDRIGASQFSRCSTREVVFIDEIGKMETLSADFVEKVESLLNSRVVLVATVGLRGRGFIEEVKRRPDVLLRTVDRSNRDRLPAEIAAWVRSRAGRGTSRGL